MEFDHRTRHTSTAAAATHSALSPGKRTLTEGIVVQRREVAATGTDPAAGETARSARAPLPAATSSGPRPTLQMLFGVQRAETAPTEGPAQDSGMPAPAGGSPIPDKVRGKMEASFGTSFAGVRLHEGAEARALGAVAYAHGEHVHLSPGVYDPATGRGEQVLAHELAHVTQQRAGRVAVPQGYGAPINADDGLEREADAAAERAVRGQPAAIGATWSAGGTGPAGSAAGGAPVQRLVYIGAGSKTPVKEKDISAGTWSNLASKDSNGMPLDQLLKALLDDVDSPLRVASEADLEAELMTYGLTHGDAVQKTFRKGDKLYGREKARKLERGRIKNDGGYLTADDMHNELGVSSGRDIETSKLDEKKDPELHGYGTWLASDDDRRPHHDASRPGNREYQSIKSGCKAMITYNTKARKEPKVIHFLLDAVDLAKVVTKTDFQPRSTLKSYTGAELRFMYRQYLAQLHDLEPDADLSQIKFYWEGEEVDPPWIAESELWAEYRAHWEARHRVEIEKAARSKAEQRSDAQDEPKRVSHDIGPSSEPGLRIDTGRREPRPPLSSLLQQVPDGPTDECVYEMLSKRLMTQVEVYSEHLTEINARAAAVYLQRIREMFPSVKQTYIKWLGGRADAVETRRTFLSDGMTAVRAAYLESLETLH